MLLKRFKVFIPGLIFAAISIAFCVIQFFVFDIIGWNYSMCNVLFGFTFPLFFSYLSFPRNRLQQPSLRQVLQAIRVIPLASWPLSFLKVLKRSIARDFNEGTSWTPWIGVAITLFFSIGNEVFVDPATNGIPFTEAYHHFLADLAGMAVFLLVTWPFVRSNHSPGPKGLPAASTGS
ncbi:hypothetical protein [Pseudomonas argentinensis]|uniref:hypothetical protein n=1 Tax=Phytopseudomonas argentinensis TaxID=289370 RepID=UPI0008A8F554|nr:hypothetical protein [Pseudomonas argentinensis]